MSRCIECSRPKEAHAEDGNCPGSGSTKYGSMDLPDGKTCGDCIHIRFCTQFLGERCLAENTQCDWFPIRFVLKPQSANAETLNSPLTDEKSTDIKA